mgnify:CR=1 FL=1
MSVNLLTYIEHENAVLSLDDSSHFVKERYQKIFAKKHRGKDASLPCFAINKIDEQSIEKIESNDKDYVFIHFILNNLPKGLIGLLLAVILSAAMSSTASELNALGTITALDLYKRNKKEKEPSKLLQRLCKVKKLIHAFVLVKKDLMPNGMQWKD